MTTGFHERTRLEGEDGDGLREGLTRQLKTSLLLPTRRTRQVTLCPPPFLLQHISDPAVAVRRKGPVRKRHPIRRLFASQSSFQTLTPISPDSRISGHRHRCPTMSRPNNVRGPNSALTEYLREKGVSAREIQAQAARRRAEAAAQAEQAAQATAEDQDGVQNDDDDDDDEGEPVAESSAAGARRRTTRSRRKVATDDGEGEDGDEDGDGDEYMPDARWSGSEGEAGARAEQVENSKKRRRSTTTVTVNLSYLGEGLDDSVTAEASASAGKRKPTKAQLKKLKEAAKKSKKGRKGDDDDLSDNSDLGFVLQRASIPIPGQIAFCAECNCRFTVTPYSRSGPNGEGLLCHLCGKKNAPVEVAARKKKLAGRAHKKSHARALLDRNTAGVKTLQELCVQLVAKHIDDVEALGSIGSYNMDKICQIISKNRSLTDHTIKLFLEPAEEVLRFYDCSKIQSNSLRQIGAFVPTLRRLDLRFCGRMTDDCLDYYATQLRQLESIEIYGAFNVTEECYIRFFQTVGKRLKGFGVGDTSRFQVAAMEALVDNCPDLEMLRLRTITHIDDECLRLLTGLPNLRVLEISQSDQDITDQPIIDILNTCGSALQELNLDGCALLTDAVLDAIHQSCGQLEILSLEELGLLTNEGLSKLFMDWSVNEGLKSLNLCRCVCLEASGLARVADHSGETLQRLNLNSCKELGEDAWGFLTGCHMKWLEEVDLSFIRSVTDTVVEDLLRVSPVLKDVNVWGCHKLTEAVQLREGLHLIGREADLVS
ncbi:hypothetical protein DRE_04436 [Drechslerella stenobrocha 248]|uniref:DNA repair protein RAD7 n=1 Tax=Drechslerella stenobrocha 248 TaxID=1043628 RepID=W7IB14_9PEZI|nr:hypothetical protein DRE_04436 [Drechslerella stenobrocha 248]